MEKKVVKTAQQIVQESWWKNLLLGLLFLAVGIALFAWPGISSIIIVRIIGGAALIMGVYKLIAAMRSDSEKKKKKEPTQSKSMLYAEAIAGIVFGALAFLFPGVVEVVTLIVIAIWLLYFGIMEIWAGFSFPKNLVSSGFKWMTVINGLLSFVVGFFLIINPLGGLIAMLWVIALYAVLFGVINIVLALMHPSRNATL